MNFVLERHSRENYAMPAIFNSLGISFQYPENWTLDDSDALLGRRSITVYSPGGAFWSVTMQSGNVNLVKLSIAIVQAMKKEYQDIEIEPAEELVAGHELKGYDFAFYYLDLTNTAKIRSFQLAHTTYTIHYQAEDREFDQLQRVFEAITTSFLDGLGGCDCND